MNIWSLGISTALFLAGATAQAQTLGFQTGAYEINEGQTVTLTVVKSGSASGPVSVHYATQDDGTGPTFATASQDYTVTEGDLTFAANETTKQIQVPITNDAVYEKSRQTFHVVLSNPTGGAALGDPSSAQVTIYDQDPEPRVQFSATNFNSTESAGTATLVITKTGATELPAVVYYRTSNGTAAAPSDYTATGDNLSASVQFEPAETMKEIAIPLHDDGYREPNETFEVHFVYHTDCYSNTGYSATVTIIDDDPNGPPPPAKALNLSTRAQVQTGERITIGGFIITGTQQKDLLIRGLGPSLAQAGVPGNAVLLDPVIRLNKGDGSFIAINDNWREWTYNVLTLEGTAFQPKDDRESALLNSLLPGAYTVWLVGKSQTQGIGLFEVYDFDGKAGAELANLSTRGYVGQENDVMIAGFILGNEAGTTRIALRGLGPSLANYGLNNFLPDPALHLHDANGAALGSNDDWQSDPVSAAQLTANGLGLPNSKEAGIFVALPPGTYTAILDGKFIGAGVGLVEVYNLK